MSPLKVGYARVSTDEQDLTAQRDGLAAFGVDPKRIYVDHGLTGRNADREGLRQALAACRDGDTFVVTVTGFNDQTWFDRAGNHHSDKLKVVDRDKDGVLSAAEHGSGSSAMFQAMDSNGDGVLDKKEFDAGHARLGK